MCILTSSLAFDLVAIVLTLVIGAITFFKWRIQYWQRLGVPTLNPSLPYGDTKTFILGRQTMGEAFLEAYRKFKSQGQKHGGIYLGLKPFYVPVDPEMVKNILQKDFAHFVNHLNYMDDEVDPLAGHLFNLEDAKWKNMRAKLTPTFTSGKMKMMFQTLTDCSVGLKDILKESAANNTAVDIRDILSRFTADVIGSVGFGLECNSLKDPDADFIKYGRKVFQIGFVEQVKMILILSVPHALLRMIKLKLTRDDVERFFLKAVRETVNYREKNNVYRKDFMHLLLQLKNRGNVVDDEKIVDDGQTQEKALTINELAAQVFVFFVAGYETSSSTMTFALYELASNQEIQDKVREEINEVLKKHDGKITYEGMMEMSYMEKVLFETLRKYPPLPVLTRKCNKDYVIPGTSITLKEGTVVGIPALGLHTDPEYYPDPEKFDPERFSEERKQERPAFTWIPFGEGPRICIGMRLGILQSKVGLTALLKNYRVKLSPKTKVPLRFDPSAIVTTAEGGIWLDVEELS